MVSSISHRTQLVKKTASELGFSFCGISKANFLADQAPFLENWLRKGFHGEMTYMENHFDKRLDPRLLVEGAKSVVSLLLNYYPEDFQNQVAPQISKYAYGDDYHLVIKEKLKDFLEILKSEIGDINGRVFVDSAPVMDKVWAEKSGLGWVGKNSNLIHPKNGSFFFIAELILDIVLEEDGPLKDYCGTCTRCIDACPTDAIVQPYVVDGSKCISYLTIELKNEIPSEFSGKMNNWAFGCDICQDVCPWNRFSKPHQESGFKANSELLGMTELDWKELSETTFSKLFNKSAVKRTKFIGLKRNIEFLKKDL